LNEIKNGERGHDNVEISEAPKPELIASEPPPPDVTEDESEQQIVPITDDMMGFDSWDVPDETESFEIGTFDASNGEPASFFESRTFVRYGTPKKRPGRQRSRDNQK
jgi:hypothetical protein